MINKKTVIKASAGTGKTYRLSLEYIYHLLSGINFRDIVVITFTKKATSEIKDRIFKFIEEIVLEKDNSKDLIISLEKIFLYKFNKDDILRLKNIYKDMLINKSTIRIDTIDGFISKIFDMCILKPIFNLESVKFLEENSDLEKEYYEELILNLTSRGFKFKSAKLDFENQKKDLKENYVNNQFFLLSNLSISEKKIDKEKLLNDFINLFKLEFEKNTFKAEIKKGVLEIFNLDKDIDYRFEKLIAVVKKGELYKGLCKKNKNLSDLEIFELNKKLLEIYENIFEYTTSIETNNLISNAKIFFEEDLKLKKKKKLISFNDKIYYTFKHIFDEELLLIKNNKLTEFFYELIGGNISVMMIDEFQDTSTQQFKLLKLMLDSSDIVTCVGDEKQSLYEWRGGNKKLFEDLDKLLGSNVEVKNLDVCYRSEDKIIKYVNDRFSKEKNYNYYNIKSIKEKDEKGYVEIINFDKEDEILSKIANDINVNKDFKNTAILLRTNADLEEIARYLDELNIKYSLKTKGELLGINIISNIQTLVEYLITKNPIKKYEFLRSQSCRITLSEMQNILEDNIGKYEKEILEKIEFFENKYSKINGLNSSIFDFPKEYIKIFGYDILENKEALININEYFKNLKNSNNLLEFYENIKNNKLEKKSVIDNNTIQLMTIHASKGLEFETVYVYIKNSSNKGVDNRNYIVYDSEYNLLEYKRVYFNTLNKIFKSIYELDSEMEKEMYLDYLKEKKVLYDIYHRLTEIKENEKLNNKYVAYTRAKKKLYVYDKAENSENLGNIDFENEENIVEKDNFKEEYLKYFTMTDYKQLNMEKYDEKRIKALKEGSAIHYFFEIYNGNFEVSKDMVWKKYSNLFNKESIDLINEVIYRNYIRYKELLDSKLEKYHEFTIYDINDERYVIDFLIIDRVSKKAYIYDFKTGENVEENPKYIKQIENYKRILKNILSDYEIEAKILAIF